MLHSLTRCRQTFFDSAEMLLQGTSSIWRAAFGIKWYWSRLYFFGDEIFVFPLCVTLPLPVKMFVPMDVTPLWLVTPPPPVRCTTMFAAKYLGLCGQICSFCVRVLRNQMHLQEMRKNNCRRLMHLTHCNWSPSPTKNIAGGSRLVRIWTIWIPSYWKSNGNHI